MKRHLFLLLAMVTVVSSLALAQNFAESKTATDRADAYRKWIDEDVRYIITPEERSRFAALQDDKERDAFVRDFWLKRDPTPGTEENEYKEEHYRRIAYSNEHFAGKLPGWRTDRGRSYIVYGPPDKIEISKTGQPEQLWIYQKSATQRMTLRFVYSVTEGEYELKR